jgi:hypothetical protein
MADPGVTREVRVWLVLLGVLASFDVAKRDGDSFLPAAGVLIRTASAALLAFITSGVLVTRKMHERLPFERDSIEAAFTLGASAVEACRGILAEVLRSVRRPLLASLLVGCAGGAAVAVIGRLLSSAALLPGLVRAAVLAACLVLAALLGLSLIPRNILLRSFGRDLRFR